jgi:hypothetical protein
MKTALAIFLCITPLLTAQTPDANAARVFITDSQSWSIAGSGGGANGAYGSTVAGGARPQTAEIIKTFGQRCPQVVINNIQTKADYIVLLDHEGGKGWARHKNKVAVFTRVSGDSIVSKSTVSLGGSVQEACEAITADWAAHGKEIRAAVAPPSAAQPAAAPAAPVPTPVSASADKAQIQVTSTPDAADIEIDGSFVGNTPSTADLADHLANRFRDRFDLNRHAIRHCRTGRSCCKDHKGRHSGAKSINASLFYQ